MRTLSIILVLLLWKGAIAQTLYVRPVAGTPSAYALANIEKLTFFNGNLLVNNTTGANGTFALSGLRYLNFTDLTLATAKEELVKNRYYIYPNPATTVLNVANDDVSQRLSRLEIISLEGRVLIAQTSPQVIVSSLPQGMYFCRITFNNKTQTIKFLKH